MKVRELIADTLRAPGRNYTAARPAVSVLMPTFRRGADGTFWRAAQSVLGQSLADLELIIVDDGSRDETAEQIVELMRQDGRVNVLTHRENIGLPAISEYEAYVRSRGDYIAFGFDDFIFERDSLSELWRGASAWPGCAVHGSAELLQPDGTAPVLGAEAVPLERLSYCNFILNGSFLVPRPILDDIGLYDPHVLASRLCDWDLWRRIHRHYPIERLPILVGRELGEARNDSLGKTHPLLYEAVQEYFARPRDQALIPSAYADFEVWDLAGPCSATLTAHLLSARRFYSAKGWARDLKLADRESLGFLASQGRPIVGVLSMPTPSTALMLDGLFDTHGAHLLFIDPTWRWAMSRYVACCDAVLVVRDLLAAHTTALAELCGLMRIPLYYVIDDNFIVLAQEIADCADYNTTSVQNALQTYAGVLCSSATLQEYFQRLQPTLPTMRFGPVFDEVKLGKMRRLPLADAAPLRVGFIGGDFRAESLQQEIVPALRRVAAHTNLRLFSRLPIDDADCCFPVTTIEFSASFDEFLVRWRRLGIDILVHGRGRSANIRYKSPSPLLIALYLGAVPIVCDEEAYRGIGEAEGVLKVDGSSRSWEAAIARAAGAELRALLLARLERYCREAFSPGHNGAVLSTILQSGAKTDVFTWLQRQLGQMQRIHEIGLFRDQLSASRASETTLSHEIVSLREQIAAGRATEATLKHEIAALREQIEVFRTAEATLRLQQEAERRLRSYRIAMLIRRVVNAGRRMLGLPTS